MIKKVFILSLLWLSFFSCKKNDTSSTTTSTTQPTVDTVITGTIKFTEQPQTFTNNNVTVTVARSCPCYPSNEIYFFTANATNITDTANTTYTWYIRMTTTVTLDGKKVQYVFPRANITNGYTVDLEVKTNNQLVGSVSFKVYPLGQQANNKNVSIHADCIDNNRKNFISFYSTDIDPIDGYVNARYWDFDDGTSSTEKFVQHEFPKLSYDKYYYVKLFVNNSSGCKDSAMQKVFVPAIYSDTVRFTWTKSDACNPNSEEFTFVADTSKMPANAIYEWDFKDYVLGVRGTVVKHKFTFPNRYDVNLRVWHEGRMISEWYDTTVVAKGQNVTPIAYFYSSVENDSANTVRRFFNCQSKFDNGGYLIDIIWDYGDGFSEHRSQYDYNARHTYYKQSTPKTYLTKMVITATSGCKDSSYATVTIPAL